MRYLTIALTCLFLAGCSIFNRHDITTSDLLETISSDAFEGRKPGTEGMKKATEFIQERFRVMDIKPFFNGSYLDTLYVYGVEAYNIVGIINEDSPVNEYILIGAHLDHLGKTASQTDSVYNGANDNASGVTAVLQIANELQGKQFNKKVLIAIFTGEESGLVGANHLARRLKDIGIPLSYMINFDMIGTPLPAGQGKIYVTGYDRSDFADVANRLLGEEFIVYEPAETRIGLFRMSDNYPFYNEYNIPAHTVSTFNFNNYDYLHHVGDEFSRLDIHHMEAVIDNMTRLITELLQTDAEIELIK